MDLLGTVIKTQSITLVLTPDDYQVFFYIGSMLIFPVTALLRGGLPNCVCGQDRKRPFAAHFFHQVLPVSA